MYPFQNYTQQTLNQHKIICQPKKGERHVTLFDGFVNIPTITKTTTIT